MIDAKICETREEFSNSGPGAVYLWNFPGKERGHILMKCPGCGEESAMLVTTGPIPVNETGWRIEWPDGKITLSPSINNVGCCKWHGDLKNGKFGEYKKFVLNSAPPVLEDWERNWGDLFEETEEIIIEPSDYLKYRGKCKEFCEEAIKADPSLKLVRGHYFCPIWNSLEAHWWTVQQDGTIYDPTKDQFPSKGLGTYQEFSGIYQCSDCGEDVPETEAIIEGNYVFCSNLCHGRFVGVFNENENH